MTKDMQWEEWKKTDTVETMTMNMFRDSNKDDLVPVIQEEKIPTSKQEENISLKVLPDKGEIGRKNKITKSSEFTYHNKEADTETSAYDRGINELKQNNQYIPTLPNINEPIIEDR